MAKRPTLSPDADLANADWTKGTWDLTIHTVKELRAYLRTQNMTVAHFKTLPIYKRNVETMPWLLKL